MMRMSVVTTMAAIGLLASGCRTMPAVIADLEEDKVIVSAHELWTTEDDVVAEAERGCALHGRTAVPISVSSTGEFQLRYLFACQE